MLTITFNQLSEKFLHMSKTQSTYYEKLRQLNFPQTTPTSYHLMWSHYTQTFRTIWYRRYQGCKKVSQQPSKVNSGNKGSINIFSAHRKIPTFHITPPMGTICAPSYANVFMDHFEKELIYPFIKEFSLIYLRFIDDIFFIWTVNNDLMRFLNELNTKHESIKFEHQISKTSILFLDTEVYIKNKKLYIKIENRQIVNHSLASTLNTLNLWRPVFRTAKP